METKNENKQKPGQYIDCRLQLIYLFPAEDLFHATRGNSCTDRNTAKIQQSRRPRRGNHQLGFSKGSLIFFPTGFASTHQPQDQSCQCQSLHHRIIWPFQQQHIHSSCLHWTVKPASKLQTHHGQSILFPIQKQ